MKTEHRNNVDQDDDEPNQQCMISLTEDDGLS
jgi:hypothetical protein